MEAEPEVLAASVESTSEKKVWPELALRGRRGEPAASPQGPKAFPGISGPSGTLPLGQAPSRQAARHHSGGHTSSAIHCLPTKPSKPQRPQRPSLTTSPVGDTTL